MKDGPQTRHRAQSGDELGGVLLGTGLVLLSLIVLPALAQRFGVAASLTLALRGALMRASKRV